MVENFGEGDFCIYLFSMDLDSRVWISDFGIFVIFAKNQGKPKAFLQSKTKEDTPQKISGLPGSL